MTSRRWWIAGLLALATALSYLDRQSFPVLVGEIRREIPISNEDFATLGSLFLLAYGLMYAGGGWILDKLGTRAGYAAMIVFWSLANAATGLVHSLAGLKACRFLLGMGEGGGFPGSGKAVAEWFPPRERSFAFGLFNTGSSLGAIVAAPGLAFISLRWGWRWVFFATGLAGLAWAAVWLALYRTPAAVARAESGPRLRWCDLFRYRQIWGLMAAKLLTDSVWFFLIFWLPKYLADARGFDIRQIGAYAWIPFVFAGLGSFLGGALGSLLLRRGLTLDRARAISLAVAACLMPAVILVDHVPTRLAIVFYSAGLFAHQFWSANVQTIGADLFPPRVVGSVEGLLGSAGALGAAVLGKLFGFVVASHGYAPVFLLAGLLHLASFVLIRTIVGRIEPLVKESAA